MKKLIGIIGIIILFLLVGCATTGTEKWCRQGSITCQYWEFSDCEKIDKNCVKEWQKETDLSSKDRASCEKVDRKNAGWKKEKELKAFESCMKSKGYVKFKKPKIDIAKIYLQVVMFPVDILVSAIYAIPK